MAWFSRKKVKDKEEQYASAQFIKYVFEEAKKGWPQLKAQLAELEVPTENIDDRSAPFDFALAGIAVHLNAIRNTFPADQASRLEKHIFKMLETLDGGDYALPEIKAYRERMDEEKENDPRDTIAAVCARLLRKWLGDDMDEIVDQFGIINPIALMMCMPAVMQLGGYFWKSIKESKFIEA